MNDKITCVHDATATATATVHDVPVYDTLSNRDACKQRLRPGQDFDVFHCAGHVLLVPLHDDRKGGQVAT
jgi:hypothetical protein